MNTKLGENSRVSNFSTCQLPELGARSRYVRNNSGQEEQNEAFPNLIATVHHSDKRTLTKRARRKFISKRLSLSLIRAEREVPAGIRDDAQIGKYWNTYHCCDKLVKRPDGKIIGSYCRRRWCPVCSSIRTAHYSDKYSPTLDAWIEEGQAFFVTLTTPNVSKWELPVEIDFQLGLFTKIAGTLKKRAQRGRGEEFRAIRALDNTYNHKDDSYHPHLHVVVYGEENASELRRRWIDEIEARHAGERTGTGKARERADYEQSNKVKRATAGTARELLKYAAKLVNEGKNGAAGTVHVHALNVIFKAIEGRRTLQTYGPKGTWDAPTDGAAIAPEYGSGIEAKPACATIIERIEKEREKRMNEMAQVLINAPDKRFEAMGYAMGYELFGYDKGAADYVNEITGELLTGYTPSAADRETWEKRCWVRPGYGGLSAEERAGLQKITPRSRRPMSKNTLALRKAEEQHGARRTAGQVRAELRAIEKALA